MSCPLAIQQRRRSLPSLRTPAFSVDGWQPAPQMTLEQQQRRNNDEQRGHGGLDEMVDPSPQMWRIHINVLTPQMEPGTLPTANASTTFRLTVPLFGCMKLAGTLVKKLKKARLIPPQPAPVLSSRRSAREALAPHLPRRSANQNADANPTRTFGTSSSMADEPPTFRQLPR